ncbi:LuxR C-terminal-related transcriptional regulator [Vreelandella aquamarina]
MKHLFITPAARFQPRWQAAFPEAVLREDFPTDDIAQSVDVIWVVCEASQPALTEKGMACIKALSVNAIVVVLSNTPDQDEAMQALQAGARGYAHALSPVETLRQIATVVTNAGIWVPANLMAQVVGNTWQALNGDKRINQAMLEKLTERERNVALAVVKGGSNKHIARDLNITERTVKAHLTSIFQKLEITDRMQLVLKLTGRAEALPESLSSTSLQN